MDDNARTLYCGNLSDKVTEDVLYELFLQGGPVQKISIPKDRDGRQRPFGFVTYKHRNSVDYALRLFDGTRLYDRPINMQPRNHTESHPAEPPPNPVQNLNYMLELGQQMILGNYPPQISDIAFDPNISQDASGCQRQVDANSGNDDRNKRNHPYQRNRDRNLDRDRNRDRDRGDREIERDGKRNRERNHGDYYRDERSYYNRDNNYRSNGYSRYNDHRKRWTYH
ncbi:RNA-binding protein 7 [Linepithema humile]|uniref:RNA-binding protein 7 n=1 Tax=Linepithema humile TaxID=83485 RepID=UPI0006233E9A|nr:PREDICTED: RNA-binding protein 7 [Linepithema humile]